MNARRFVEAVVSEVNGVESQPIDWESPISISGMDSIGFTSLLLVLEDYGVKIPEQMDLLDVTPRDLAHFVSSQLEAEGDVTGGAIDKPDMDPNS